MKIALYIEDGLEQIVLTPETATEKSILAKMHDGGREMSVKRGAFYGCQGGWVRQRDQRVTNLGREISESDDSTMIVLRAPEPVSEPSPEA